MKQSSRKTRKKIRKTRRRQLSVRVSAPDGEVGCSSHSHRVNRHSDLSERALISTVPTRAKFQTSTNNQLIIVTQNHNKNFVQENSVFQSLQIMLQSYQRQTFSLCVNSGALTIRISYIFPAPASVSPIKHAGEANVSIFAADESNGPIRQRQRLLCSNLLIQPPDGALVLPTSNCRQLPCSLYSCFFIIGLKTNATVVRGEMNLSWSQLKLIIKESDPSWFCAAAITRFGFIISQP